VREQVVMSEASVCCGGGGIGLSDERPEEAIPDVLRQHL
jgi:hypothetical protein